MSAPGQTVQDKQTIFGFDVPQQEAARLEALIDAALEEMDRLREGIRDSQERTRRSAAETHALLTQLDVLLPGPVKP
jgi:hypothetical protein